MSNIVTGGLAILLGVVAIVWVIPAQTVPAIFASVESGFYPNFTSSMLIASGAALAISGFFGPPPEASNVSVPVTLVRFFAALILLTGTMVAVPALGFIPAGIAICLVTLLLMREGRKTHLLAISVIAPVVVWLLFDALLGRPLP